MSRPKREIRKHVERYEAGRSPLAQHPSQHDLALLLGAKKAELRALVNHKEDYIVRRDLESGRKVRHLAYPVRRLRRVHERAKYHLSKIKLPTYLYSPRARRSQRDNALLHVGQTQYLALDIKQFYPSTTRDHVFYWARDQMGMFPDVAGLLADLLTVDGRASFGSPATPVLVALVFREMFDEIEAECLRRGLRISLWVDDIVISGNFVPGQLISFIQVATRARGLKTHKLRYKTGSRAVLVTGIPVRGDRLDAPQALHNRIREAYAELLNCTDPCVYRMVADRLLNALGTYRYIVGRATPSGVKASNRMAALRQRRAKIPFVARTERGWDLDDQAVGLDDSAAPF